MASVILKNLWRMGKVSKTRETRNSAFIKEANKKGISSAS